MEGNVIFFIIRERNEIRALLCGPVKVKVDEYHESLGQSIHLILLLLVPMLLVVSQLSYIS